MPLRHEYQRTANLIGPLTPVHSPGAPPHASPANAASAPAPPSSPAVGNSTNSLASPDLYADLPCIHSSLLDCSLGTSVLVQHTVPTGGTAAAFLSCSIAIGTSMSTSTLHMRHFDYPKQLWLILFDSALVHKNIY
mmetsp:Transcript_46356/g.106267  ORF Transcript_46356/g.106267 Transcript_46356/m.106267 type:complete len:136 (-) Transcript_46356:38-445(-)